MGFPYDYESIMHYPWAAFSSNGKDTLTPMRNTQGKVPYIELSPGDAAETSRLYNCPGTQSFLDDFYVLCAFRVRELM